MPRNAHLSLTPVNDAARACLIGAHYVPTSCRSRRVIPSHASARERLSFSVVFASLGRSPPASLGVESIRVAAAVSLSFARTLFRPGAYSVFLPSPVSAQLGDPALAAYATPSSSTRFVVDIRPSLAFIPTVVYISAFSSPVAPLIIFFVPSARLRIQDRFRVLFHFCSHTI